MSSQFLFIYGTLLVTDNEFAIYLQKNVKGCCKAKFKGKLYDAGNYPVAIKSREEEVWVQGSIVELIDAPAVLKHIDPYEGYGEGQPQPYLYLRELVKAETDNGEMECWVYIYNHPINDFHEIKSGDYLEYLKKKKSR